MPPIFTALTASVENNGGVLLFEGDSRVLLGISRTDVLKPWRCGRQGEAVRPQVRATLTAYLDYPNWPHTLCTL